MTVDYVKLAKELGDNMTDGQEINRLKLEVEALKKEMALVREDAQVQILSLEKRNNELRELLRETVILRSKDLRDSDMTSLFEIIQRYVNKQGGELA